MSTDPRPPRLLATLLIAPAVTAMLALLWYAKWVVVQGYPPLRITSLALGAAGLVALPGGIVARRWTRRLHAEALRMGRKVPALPPALTARDWILSALYGLLVMAVLSGAQSLALTRVPLAVVAITAIAGETWHPLVVRRLRGPTGALAGALAAAGLLAVTLGPDAGGAGLMALLLIGPLLRAVARAIRSHLASAPGVEIISLALLVAAVVLQLAGLWRGEVITGVPLRATLALFAPFGLVIGYYLLVWLAGPVHRGVLRCAMAANLLAIALIGQRLCDQPVALVTWLAAALVTGSALLQPLQPAGESRP